MEAFNKLKEAGKTYKKMVEDIGKQAMGELLAKLFEDHPKIQGVRWRQYAPHFNDGDACVFGLHGLCAKIEGKPEDGGDYGDGYLDAFSITYEDDTRGLKTIKKAVEAAEKQMEECLDVLETAFGDSVMVTVSRDGKVEVEDYDHD